MNMTHGRAELKGLKARARAVNRLTINYQGGIDHLSDVRNAWNYSRTTFAAATALRVRDIE